jgi:hypothetical protein
MKYPFKGLASLGGNLVIFYYLSAYCSTDDRNLSYHHPKMLDAIFFFVKRKNHKETALTIANIIIKENNDRKKRCS